jgi:hypothetical protein
VVLGTRSRSTAQTGDIAELDIDPIANSDFWNVVLHPLELHLDPILIRLKHDFSLWTVRILVAEVVAAVVTRIDYPWLYHPKVTEY